VINQVLSLKLIFRVCRGEGKRFLHGDLICTYTLPEHIYDIYVHGLCIISAKLNSETVHDVVRRYLFTAQKMRDDITGWKDK